MLRSSASSLLRPRWFSSLADGSFGGDTSSSVSEKIAVAVLFERLPVVIPKTDPVVYAVQELSYRRRYPDEVLGKANARFTRSFKIVSFAAFLAFFSFFFYITRNWHQQTSHLKSVKILPGL